MIHSRIEQEGKPDMSTIQYITREAIVMVTTHQPMNAKS